MKKPQGKKVRERKNMGKGKRFSEKPLQGQESEKPYKAEKVLGEKPLHDQESENLNRPRRKSGHNKSFRGGIILYWPLVPHF